jgi:hypothetical protein
MVRIIRHGIHLQLMEAPSTTNRRPRAGAVQRALV